MGMRREKVLGASPVSFAFGKSSFRTPETFEKVSSKL